ncbi:MAG: DNA-binding response regulator [Novosphingobium sp.]|nr:DNA-binding response regulator [Novosphingobium sp.]
MTHSVVLISPNAIAREGLSRIISSADFHLVSSGAAASDIAWAACDDRILAVIDAGHDSHPAQGVGQVLDHNPQALCVVLVDEFNYDGMIQCFEQNARGYIVKDMPCSPLITSLQLASLGEMILPAGLLDVVLRQSAFPPSPQGDGQKIDRANLSQREMDVLCCLTAGYPNKLIARQLDVSEATVKVHVKAILRKLKVGNRTQAAMWGTSRGISANTPLPALN